MTNLLDAPLLSLNAIEETVNILKKARQISRFPE